MKRRISAVEARQKLGELLNGVYYQGDEVVIERAGKVMGVVIPQHRYEAMERDRERLFDFADGMVLAKIANITRGRYWKVKDPTTIEAVYRPESPSAGREACCRQAPRNR